MWFRDAQRTINEKLEEAKKAMEEHDDSRGSVQKIEKIGEDAIAEVKGIGDDYQKKLDFSSRQ